MSASILQRRVYGMHGIFENASQWVHSSSWDLPQPRTIKDHIQNIMSIYAGSSEGFNGTPNPLLLHRSLVQGTRYLHTFLSRKSRAHFYYYKQLI